MITSAHNSRVQLVQSLLGRPRERQEQNAFVAEGVRLIEEAAASNWPFRFGLFTDEMSPRGMDLVRRLQGEGAVFEEVSPNILKTISETRHSQGILAVLEKQALPIPAGLTFALVLDAIRDPGNLGTLLRTAAAAGVQAVFLPPETADAFAPKVVRAGMGAHFRLPIFSLSWEEIQAHLKGLTVYLAEMEAELSCWQADFRPPAALIIGGEADGASEPARELAEKTVSIPMPGRAESLNAAAAGAVLMFEVVRQRGR